MLPPIDFLLKVRMTTVSWSDIRITHANQDPYAAKWTRLHLYERIHWSCNMACSANGLRAGWEYSRDVPFRAKGQLTHRNDAMLG
jgi:hypothetical protein